MSQKKQYQMFVSVETFGTTKKKFDVKSPIFKSVRNANKWLENTDFTGSSGGHLSYQVLRVR